MERAPTQTALFAAGCFWGVEAAFQNLPGVVHTQVGYTGGNKPDPSYEQVCSGTTGHAEAVCITFDPTVTTYTDLLRVFWKTHDPTTRDRQGPDVGSQYRSALFTYTQEQQQQAEASLQERQQKLGRPIVTDISPAPEFYRAEEYHQRYLEKNGGGCHLS